MPTKTTINLDIFKEKVWNKNTLSKKEMKDLILKTLEITGIQKNFVVLNISFVGAQKMIEINTKYNNTPKTTNVLSFETKQNNLNLPQNALFGEMVLCYEKLKQESEEFNKTFKERLYHIFVHSILHLLGYDHKEENERQEMEKLEEKILAKFGIKNPYFITD